MKKPSRKTLKLKADKRFRDLIRSRGVCELAGLDHIACSGDLQTMHIVGRANHNLRWDSANALCGCSGHHFYYTNNPFFFFELIKEHFADRYVYLQEHKNEIWDGDYEKVLEGL